MKIFDYIATQRSFLEKVLLLQPADAADLIQDVYEIAWRKKGYFESKPIQEQEHIASYVIRNRWYDLLRRRKAKKRVATAQESKATLPSVYAQLELEVVTKTMHEKKMSPLFDIAMGYTTPEVMRRHHLKEMTLLSRIFRSRKILKQIHGT